MNKIIRIILMYSVAFTTASFAEERLVRLKSEVRVSGRFVLLKDLLVNEDNITPKEAELIIVAAPERGTRKLSPRSIAYKMQEHKSLMDLGIMSPPIVRITRVADVNFVEHVKDEITVALSELEPWKEFNVQLQLSDEDVNIISDMSGADEIEVVSQKPSRNLTTAKIRIRFAEKGNALGTVTLNPSIQREIDIVILQDSVKSGDVITKSNVKIAKVWSSGNEDDFCLTLKECLGYEVRKSMVEGSNIPLNFLTDPVYAQKGEIIDVEYVNGGMSLFIKAKALQQGRRGDDIRVKNTSSGKVFTASMVKDGLGRVN